MIKVVLIHIVSSILWIPLHHDQFGSMHLVCITRDWDAQTQCPRWDNGTLQGSHRHRTQRACVMSALDWIPHGPAMPDLSWLRMAAFPANWLADRSSASVLVEVVTVAMVVIQTASYLSQEAKCTGSACCGMLPADTWQHLSHLWMCPLNNSELQLPVQLYRNKRNCHTTHVPSFAPCIN